MFFQCVLSLKLLCLSQPLSYSSINHECPSCSHPPSHSRPLRSRSFSCCGTLGHDLVSSVLGKWLDAVILEVFSHRSDSVILCFICSVITLFLWYPRVLEPFYALIYFFKVYVDFVLDLPSCLCQDRISLVPSPRPLPFLNSEKVLI